MSAATGLAAEPRIIIMGGHEYLDIAGIAERIGIKPDSVQTYHKRAVRGRRDGDVKPWDLPEPDARFGGRPVWLVATVEAWEAARPGTNTEAATKARRKS